MGMAEVRTEAKTTRNADQHMKTTDKCVGLDVHKDTTVVAVAEGGREGEVRLYGTISSDPGRLKRGQVLIL
jgi:hypothetical protein